MADMLTTDARMEREPMANERAVADHLRTTNGFEAMARSADCPSMTMTFHIPEGVQMAGGIFRIERIRSATDEDLVRFGGKPEPLCYHCGKSDQDF